MGYCLNLRDEDYSRIKRAAHCALRHLSPQVQKEITLGDLIVHGWYHAFRYARSYADFDEHGYHDCVREMMKYAIHLARQHWRYLGLPAARVLALKPGLFYDPELNEVDAAMEHDWDAVDAAIDGSILIAGLELTQERAALGNFYLEQCSAVESARRMGISKSTFNRTRRRALAHLRHEKPACREAKGCRWLPEISKWMAYIVIKGKQKVLGYFPTEQEAHQVYVKAKNTVRSRRETPQAMEKQP